MELSWKTHKKVEKNGYYGCLKKKASKEKIYVNINFGNKIKPIELWTDKVIQQKIDYIHNNPVATGFVTNAVDWKYTSARNYQDDHTVLEIDSDGYLLRLTK